MIERMHGCDFTFVYGLIDIVFHLQTFAERKAASWAERLDCVNHHDRCCMVG